MPKGTVVIDLLSLSAGDAQSARGVHDESVRVGTEGPGSDLTRPIQSMRT